MVRVFLVLPDLSRSKAEALARLGKVDVLLSYTILRWKPSALERLRVLRSRLGEVMLDSGAYHQGRGEAWVDPASYASFANKNRSLFNYVVAPDHPGDPGETLARTLRFMDHYPGEFIPVVQPGPGHGPHTHIAMVEQLDRAGVLERAPRAEGGVLVGVGGLDGERRRVSYIAALVREAEREYPWARLHLFGAGARILAGLARRGLLGQVYSVDSSGWLAEIMWRRRTVHNADTPLEANARAIEAYIEKVRQAVEEA